MTGMRRRRVFIWLPVKKDHILRGLQNWHKRIDLNLGLDKPSSPVARHRVNTARQCSHDLFLHRFAIRYIPESCALYHYRDKDQDEVDFVIETGVAHWSVSKSRLALP